MPPNRSRSGFETTRWHIVLAAGTAATPDSREALALLYEQYWYPLYAYLRRVGHPASDAEDLTEGFFLRLLEQGVLQAVDPTRGRAPITRGLCLRVRVPGSPARARRS